MKAIILAAGRGSRLMPYTRDVPKCMIEFGGKTFLEYQLNMLIEVGIKDVTIVTGYLGHKIQEACEKYKDKINFTFFHNLDYENSGTLNSMSLARDNFQPEYFKDGLIVLNSDIIFKKKCLKDVMKCKHTCVTMELGRHEVGATCIKIDEDNVINMGFLDHYDASGLSVGIVKFAKKDIKEVQKFLTNYPPTVHSYVFHIIKHFLEKKIPVKCSLCDYGEWCEIDTPADLKLYKGTIKKILKIK